MRVSGGDMSMAEVTMHNGRWLAGRERVAAAVQGERVRDLALAGWACSALALACRQTRVSSI
jgi:hypothetical protein